MEAIFQNVPQWKPTPSSIKCEIDSNQSYEASRLTFATFNLESVLQKGAHLIGSEGSEFDCGDDGSTNEDSNGSIEKDRLIRQRMLLNEKLGLNQSSQLGILNINDLVTLDDLRNTSAKKTESIKSLQPVQDVLNLDARKITEHMASGATAPAASTNLSLSCREMNRAKRKARQFQSQTSTNNGSNNVTSNSATFSRSNSLSNGSANDDQPEAKRPKSIETEFVPCSNGNYW